MKLRRSLNTPHYSFLGLGGSSSIVWKSGDGSRKVGLSLNGSFGSRGSAGDDLDSGGRVRLGAELVRLDGGAETIFIGHISAETERKRIMPLAHVATIRRIR